MKKQNRQFDIEKKTDEEKEKAEQQILEESQRIDFYIAEYTIELLAQKMTTGDFEIPKYQREFTWEDTRKSKFIESILMGLPIPFLFFWENPKTGNLEIVDGVQRLKTIEEFINKDYVIGELEELSLLCGFRFKDLPIPRQKKIKNRSIRGIILNEHTDEQSRFDLFERINTGSKIANKAEVRRGALGGEFLNLVMELAKNEDFIKLAPVSQKQLKEREREELVTRFFAYSDGLEEYQDRVSSFLYNYTKKMNNYFNEKPSEIENYRRRFITMMNFVSSNFTWGFRRTKAGKVTPRSRFESIAIGSYLALKENPNMADQKIETDEWLFSEEFKKIIGSDGANAKAKLLGRINFVKQKLVRK